MIEAIRNYFRALLSDPKFLIIRKRLFYFAILFIILFIANRFLFIHFADRIMFNDSIERTRIAFSGNGSVYTSDIEPSNEIMGEQIKHQKVLIGEAFQMPIYALLFYLPFSLIKDLNVSLALWITGNQLLCFLVIGNLFRLMDIQLKKPYADIISLSALMMYFFIINIFHTNLAIIQIFLLTTAIQKIREQNYIQSGILFGLAAFNLLRIIIPFLILLLNNFRKNRNTVITWFIITLIILSLAFLISDLCWLMDMIKNILLDPSVYPLISYRSYLNKIMPSQSSILVEIIPIVVFLWIIIEWLRSPRENQAQELWLVSLGMTLNPLLNMWDSPYSTIAYIFVMIYCVSFWFERTSRKFHMLALVLLYGLFTIFPLYKMVSTNQIVNFPQANLLNILMTILLLLNLYWVRLWVMNPYATINQSQN